MARIQGLVGGMSGKMGNAVFRQRYGQTIVSQYQPVVNNPNTSGQQVARAKFKLITQLAAIMAPAMGSMGVINRPARQGRNPRTGFVQRNYALMTPEPSTGAAEKVTIPMEQLQLTDSVDFFGVITANAGETGNTSLHVVINSPLTARPKKAKIALVGFGTKGAVDRPARARVIEVVDVPFIPEDDGTLDYNFTVKPGEDYTILAFGMEEVTEGTQSLDYNNIHTPADDGFISQVNIERAVSEGSMRLTETIGVNYTAPTE